ncbi:MAG: glycosyltransferase family 1 protein [Saprospiraceae bacterium]
MFKIGFDAKRLYQNFTGLGNYSRSLVSGLNSLFPDHEYHLYSPGIKKNPATLPFLENPDFKNHIYKGVLGSWWRTYGVVKEIASDKLDLYHGLSHELPEGLERLKVKKVVTMHDLVIKTHPDLFPWMDRKIYDKKFQSACERADSIVAISESTRQDVLKFYEVAPAKVHTIYQTCDPIFWAAEDQENRISIVKKYNLPESYLLYVGSVIERKNLLNLVKALELIPAGKRIPLVVVGEGKKYFEKVKKYIKGKDLEKWVLFIKPSFEELPEIYRAATLFIYPSIYEGFGIPLLEAHCCETPVMTTNLSSLPEAGGPGASYIDPYNIEEIAFKILKVIENEDLQQRMVSDSKAYIERFKPEGVTTQMMDLYLSLLNAPE